jgi:hypothetical protein
MYLLFFAVLLTFRLVIFAVNSRLMTLIAIFSMRPTNRVIPEELMKERNLLTLGDTH